MVIASQFHKPNYYGQSPYPCERSGQFSIIASELCFSTPEMVASDSTAVTELHESKIFFCVAWWVSTRLSKQESLWRHPIDQNVLSKKSFCYSMPSHDAFFSTIINLSSVSQLTSDNTEIRTGETKTYVRKTIFRFLPMGTWCVVTNLLLRLYIATVIWNLGSDLDLCCGPLELVRRWWKRERPDFANLHSTLFKWGFVIVVPFVAFLYMSLSFAIMTANIRTIVRFTVMKWLMLWRMFLKLTWECQSIYCRRDRTMSFGVKGKNFIEWLWGIHAVKTTYRLLKYFPLIIEWFEECEIDFVICYVRGE